MKYELVTEALNNLRNGTFYRMKYQTELPLKASWKKRGYKVVKIAETTVRFGVKYSNIASVITRRLKENIQQVASKKDSNFRWVIENKLSYNSNTDKYYVNAFPTKKGTHTKSAYIVYFPEGETYLEDTISIRDMVVDSYWKDNGYTEKFIVNIDNIITIDKYGDVND